METSGSLQDHSQVHGESEDLDYGETDSHKQDREARLVSQGQDERDKSSSSSSSSSSPSSSSSSSSSSSGKNSDEDQHPRVTRERRHSQGAGLPRRGGSPGRQQASPFLLCPLSGTDLCFIQPCILHDVLCTNTSFTEFPRGSNEISTINYLVQTMLLFKASNTRRGKPLWGARLHFHFSLSCIGEGNCNPLQKKSLGIGESPRVSLRRLSGLLCGPGPFRQKWGPPVRKGVQARAKGLLITVYG
ncbi:hypothetical protein FD754_009636 [Muntiacus muntjak]|uniref:Uncharacterized protein n=1 Tax=Muntiacus muntjak TaxID=9888 RepID=A0A5N3WUI4_MUNMU|nr:hypothetical protein FD754_009636 [Muntiacus muntjak]